jgi:hypothetical protein
MDQHSNIEALMRQKLYDAEVTPPAFVWPNVEAALRKRKRRIFFWIFSGTGLAILCTVLLVRDGSSHHPAPQIALSTESQLPQVVGASSPEAGLNQPNHSNAGQKSQVVLPETSTIQDIPTQTTVARQALAFSTQKPGKAQKIKNGTPPTFSLDHNAVQPTLLSSAETGLLANEASPTLSAPANAPFSVDAITEDFSTDQTSQVSVEKPQMPFLPGLFTPLYFPSNPGDPSDLTRKYVRKKKEPQTCYNFTKHPNAWFVDVYTGPSFAVKALSTNNPEYKDYLQRRRSTERRDWAFNGGVRGTLMIDGHFMLRMGLHYEQMTEVFEFIDPNTIIVDLQDRITIVNGQQVVVHDTIGVRYGSNYSKTYNRFGMLEIPVQAGVELRKGRSGFSFNAGVSFNMFFWKRGAILDPFGTTRFFTPGKMNGTEIFQKRTSLSAIGSVQWFYHLKPNLRIYAEPYFRQIVQPVNRNSHPIGTHYGVGGISIGLTKIL